MVRGILAEQVPDDSLVCEVGGSSWTPLGEVIDFGAALARRAEEAAMEIDPDPDPDSDLDAFDEDERTMVDRISRLGVSAPDPDDLHRFEDVDEHTIVDPVPWGASKAES
jgi:hypothetical protein